jgi:hypothetical protein
LFDLITVASEQREDAVWTAEVRRANDHKVSVATPKIALDFRKPVAIPRVENPIGECREICQ